MYKGGLLGGEANVAQNTVIEYRAGNSKRTPKFSSGVLRVTRANSDCPCRICKIAKQNAIIKSQGKPGHVSETTPIQPGIRLR